MNLELILWIAGGIVLWEIIYIIMLKKDDGDWLELKLRALVIAVILVVISLCLVFANNEYVAHYINLLWGGLIILGLVLFFLLNKWLYYKIE